MSNTLNERQLREIAYHSERAAILNELRRNVSYDVLTNPDRRWWNHYWAAWSILLKAKVRGKSGLVPGCGEGFDAIRLSTLGADVCAFDISPDMLRLAEQLASKEDVRIDFKQMACEELSYADNTFDLIFAHDVLHHCDIHKCLLEFVRVARPGALVVIDELYTHSTLQRVRESKFGCWLRSMFLPYIYPNALKDTYTTEDERKLNEIDLVAIQRVLTGVSINYYGMVVERVLPSWDTAAKADRLVLRLLGPAGFLVAGRFILTGFISK